MKNGSSRHCGIIAIKSKFSIHLKMETKKDEPKRETTQEYLASLGLGQSKRQKKREEEKTVKKDFTADIEAAIALSKTQTLSDAIQTLLPLEKKTRLVQDSVACSTVVTAMLDLIFKANEWKKLSETVTMIAKRRSALQKVIYKMVLQAMTYIKDVPNQEIEIELIEALRKVVAGKIFVELEEARLARMLAEIKEKQGDIAEAANILQEVQVETCGSMEAREKAEFMLEQVRLVLAKKDWVRSKIMCKKLKRKVLTEQGFHDLKLSHCRLATSIHIHEDDMLALANDFLSVFNTPSIQESDEKWTNALQRVVLFVVLAPFGKDQADLLQRTFREKKIDLLPTYKNVLNKFTTMEVIHWSDIERLVGITGHALFSGAEWSDVESKEVSSERGTKYLKLLQRRTTGKKKVWFFSFCPFFSFFFFFYCLLLFLFIYLNCYLVQSYIFLFIL